MRTAHNPSFTRARAALTLGALVVVAGLIFAFAPLRQVAAARQSMAARISDNPAITRILSLAPKSVLSAIGIKAPNTLNAAAPLAALNNNENIAITSVPPSGSSVNPNDFIVYTITATNGAATPGSPDNDPEITVNVPTGTIFKGITTGGSDPFNCNPPNSGTPGPTSFICKKNSNFASNSNSIVIMAVQVTAPSGSISTNAVYEDDDNDGSPNPPKTSNTVTHNIAVAPGPAADLQLTKTATPSSNPVVAGSGTIKYDTAISNNGPNAANGVKVYDIVPPNSEVTAVSVPGGVTCTGLSVGAVGGTAFNCSPNAAPWPSGSSATISYTVKVLKNVLEGALIANTALITSTGANSSPDPTPTNNYGITRTPVKALADLSVVMSGGPDPVCAGGLINFQVTIKNDGPSDAQNVVLQELLHPQPNFLFNTFVSIDPSGAPGFACSTPSSGGTGSISCSAATFPAGATATFYIKTKVRSDFTGPLAAAWGNNVISRALISSSTTDQDQSFNEDTIYIAVKDCADVEVVSKVDNPDPVTAGEKLTYDIVVRNNGPTDATGVYLKDTIPSGTSFVSATATGLFAGGCDSSITCTPPDGIFPAGAISTIKIVVKVNPGEMGPINNLAKIFTDTNENGNTGNNEKSAQTQVVKKTDLSIKKLGPTTVTAGNNYTYTLVVRNDGPSDAPASAVTVSDDLDSRLTHLSNTVTGTIGFNCSSNGTDPVSCTNSSVFPAGGVATITVAFKVNAGVAANSIIPNTATVSSSNDPNNNNNSSTTSTAGQTSADLQLNKFSTPSAVIAGSTLATDQITYTINYLNSGPSKAINVNISDFVPANTIAVGTISAPGLSCNGATATPGAQFNCSPNANAFGAHAAGELPVGASGALTYKVRAPANTAAGTIITNQAQIASTGSSTTPDPNPSNNTQGPTSTLVNTKANLSIAKDDLSDPVVAGNNVTYRLRVGNTGPSDAQNVVVTDILHPETSFVSLDTGSSGFTCVAPAAGSTGTVSCTRAMAPAGASNLDILATVKVNPNFTGGSVSNTAEVSSSTEGSGDTDSETTTVNKVADVELLSKTDAPDPVVAGQNLTYTITFRNNGPSAAQGVKIEDAVPTNTTFVAVFPPIGYTCATPQTGQTGTVSCEPPDKALAPGEIATIKLVVKVNTNPSSTTISNTATISTTTSQGSNTAADSKTETTTVNRETDLSIKKTGPAVVTAGNQYTYTILVRNDGPSDAPANTVTVADDLSSNLTHIDNIVTGSGGFTCSADGVDPISCNNGSVFPAGGTATITVTFKVNDGVAANTIIVNTATVSSSNDQNGANNSSTTSTAGQTSADLELAKTATAGPVTAGSGQITYTIVIANNGPSNANGVVVTDNIPANTNLVGSPAWTPVGAGSCAVSAGGTITCSPTNGTMTVGQTATITYTVSVPANALNGTLATNQANIASTGSTSTPDPNPANNTQNPTSTLIVTEADLTIVKDDSGAVGLGPDPVTAGNTVTYRLRVGNAGPSDAQNVVVTDVLNPNTTFVSVNTGTSGFSCSTPAAGSTGTVSCLRATLPAGSSNQDILVTVRVNPGFTGSSIANTARVASSTSDNSSGNNSESETTNVNVQADVELFSKTDAPDPVVAGQTLTYTITFRNNGPGDAQGVKIEDAVPTNTTFISATPPVGYTCAVPQTGSGGAVSCSPPGGVLAAGEIAAIKMTVQVVTNPTSLTISNTATISTTTSQGANTAPDSKTETTTVKRETDLSIKKSGPAVVTAGNQYTYTIVVRNDGPSDAPANTVKIADDLDGNLTHISNVVTGSGGFTCSANGVDPLSCNNGSLFPVGGAATITVTFKVNDGVPANTIIVNTAMISSDNDPNPANNTSTTSTAGQTSADIQLTKTAAPPSVIAGSSASGDEIIYTINIQNSGPSVANNIVVSDVVPANTTVTAQPAFTSTGSPSIAMTCTSATAGAQFTCTINGGASMPVGAAGTIIYKVRVPATVAVGAIVTNQAEIASKGATATPDPNPSNNTQSPTSTLVKTQADLSVTKTDSPDPVKAGDNITYTINVSTAGPSDAQNAVMSDTVPANTTFVSMTAPAEWTCSTPSVGGTGTVSCSRATLPAGSAAQTFTMIVKVNNEFTGSSISNTAKVSSTTSEPSPDSGSNTATATTTVSSQSSVAVTKQITGLPPGSQPPTIAAGNLVSYTISVSNAGPSDAVLGASGLSDTIPANTTFVSFSGTGILGGSACNFAGSTLTCLPNGIVPAGTTAAANNVKLVLRVNSEAPVGSLPNTATATVTTSNTGGQTPSSTATVTVVRSVDLTISKKAPDFVRAGDAFSYTITVTNNGPSAIPASPAGGVTVTDVLPSQVTFLGASATGAGNFTAAGTSTVTFSNNAAIPVGGVATLIINVRVNSGVPVNTQITNTATVTENLADTTDPVTGNNTSTAVSTTTTGADLQLSKAADRNSVESGGGASTGRITYTIKIANSGPSTANAVQVTDNVPAFSNLVGSVSFAGTSFTPSSGGPAPAAPTGTCSVDASAKITCVVTSNSGALLIGQGATIAYTVEVPAGVAIGTVITNQATVASVGPDPTADPNTANNTDLTNTVVSFGADLSVEKTSVPADGSSVIAGQFIDYTITIKNDGPSDAQNVTVTETLSNVGTPTATSVRSSFVSLDASGAPGFTCSTPSVGGTGSITCYRAILPRTGVNPPTLKIRVLVDPSASTGTVDNRVSVTSSTADPDLSDNDDSTSHPVSTFSTLALVKSAQPNPVIAGQNLTYTLSVTNNGASDALNVVLKDTIPAFTSLVSFSGTGVFTAAGTCAFDNATSTLQCSPNAGPPFAAPSGAPPTGGTLPKGATGTITLVVKVDPNIPADAVGPNSFTGTSTTPGASGTSNGVTVNVIRRSDLEIVKRAPSTGVAGDVIDYTLTIKNNGPSGAPTGVVATDVLPPGTTFISLNQSGAPSFGTCTTPAVGSNGVVSCATDKLLPAGAVETIIIKVRIASSIAENTNIINCATVTAPEPPEGDAGPIDPIPGNNKSCAATAVRTSADLGVTKTGATSGVAGTPITYTINFGNAGPSDAVNVRITDPIPNNTTLTTATPFTVVANDNNPATPPVNVVCSFTGGQIVCTPAGNGPTYADGVLPAGYTGSFQFTALINASVTGGTLITNQVNITSAPGGTQGSTPDPNPGNNTAVVTNTVVVAQSQLSITKAIQAATFAQAPPAPSGAVVPGTQLTYRITVTNNGPSDVSNIRMIDTIPGNAKYVTINQSGGFGTIFTCSPPTGIVDPNGNGGLVQCTAPSMSATPGNNVATIDLTVFIDPSTKASLVNKADVNATVNNFNQPTSATFTLTTPVGPQSDIVATKTHDVEPDTGANTAGKSFTYTITVKNNGPSTAAMINVKDILPAGQTLDAAPDVTGAPGFTCAPSSVGSGGTINCYADKLLPSATAVIRLKVKIDSCQTPGRYVNEVRVSSMSNNHSSQAPVEPATAPQTGVIYLNARVTDNVDVVARPDLSITKTAPATVISGTTMTYTLEAINNGPSCANNVMITDVLPAGTVFVSQTTSPAATTVLTPSVGANGAVKATWTGLTKPGEKRMLTIIVRVCSEVTCDTILANTATVSYDPRIPSPNPNSSLIWDVDPNTQNNSATAETKAQAQSDLSIVKGGPASAPYSATGNPSIVTYTLSFSNAGPSNAAGVKIVDVLPKGFTVEGQPTSSVPGTIFTFATTDGVTTITATLGILGAANQCATTRPTSGTITIRARVPIHHPVVSVTNTAVISTTNCLPDPDLTNNTSFVSTYIVAPGTDPVSAYPAGTEVSDQQPGSVLFFPIYTSDAVSNNAQNTRINITNISTTERACVHLFAIDGSTCAVLDAFVCLTPNQTMSYLASDFDPGSNGYLMAVAVDCETGLPTNFNCLIGDEYVRFATGHQANLGAESIQALTPFPTGTNASVTSATLRFDGVSYNRLPRVLAADNIPSVKDGNQTMLILDRIGGDYTTSGATIGSINGQLFDDSETGYSFTASLNECQIRQTLTNSFPRTFTPFSNVIPAGRSGWMKFWTVDDRALFGVMINYNPSATSKPDAFNQGHNLHKLTLTDKATVTVPVFLPTCSN